VTYWHTRHYFDCCHEASVRHPHVQGDAASYVSVKTNLADYLAKL